LFAAFVGAPIALYAQGDTIVEIPTAHDSIIILNPTARQKPAESDSNNGVTMAGEYKSTKNVVEQQKEELNWTLNFQAGYWSEYLFRGTNLTPNSDGIEYQQAYFSIKGFTVGLWFADQLGKAVVPNATVVGEAGGGFSPFGAPFNPTHEDFAVQYRFKELDVFSSYTHSFGPLDITVGNIAFFIFRSSVDQFRNLITGTHVDYAVPEDETFDRVFIALSTTKIHPGNVAIIPTVTYYQTIYNHVEPIMPRPGELGPANFGLSESEYELEQLAFKRNDKLGGYLEGKVQAVIPIVKNVVRLQPTALISYSAGDRSESVSFSQAAYFASGNRLASSKPLYGFNHFQGGAELVLQITSWLSVTGFGDYAYHIAHPVAGTDRDEEWGGGYVTLSF